MIAIISDIHGNFEALKSVLNDIDNLGVKEIYCLGDVVGYYPQVNECCTELIKRNIHTLIGNHDWYLISGTRSKRSKSADLCLDFQSKIINKQSLDWLKSNRLLIVLDKLCMVHGGWKNPIDEYLFNIENSYFDKIPFDFFVSGHTHIPVLGCFNGKKYCNPGSVGQPRDDDYRASYAIFDGNDFTINRVDYDVEKICQISKMNGYDEYLYNRLRYGYRNFK